MEKLLRLEIQRPEGRLVLADVLSFAQQEVDADYIFDMATLTGASVVAVGNYTSTVMGFNDEVKDMVIQASQEGWRVYDKIRF